TGGYAAIEAMFNELPVICLDCGGPAVAVRDNCGTKIPLGPREKVVMDLSDAIQTYAQNRGRVIAQGKEARKVVLEYYDWAKKGAEMNERYLKVLAQHSRTLE